LYNLEGVASGPEVASELKLETPAKTALPFTVPVTNWLRRPQRFMMEATLWEGAHPSTELTGAKTVEVPPLATRDFALRFMAYKEGVTSARVTFTNDQTGEYLFHEIAIEATAPGIQETIELEGSVRRVTRHLITVANPLQPTAAITFPEERESEGGGGGWWSSGSPHVRLTRVGEMTGNLEGVFALEYRPLLPTESGPEDTEIRIEINELGVYRYTLRLSANAPALSSTLRFESALGATQSEAFTMRVYNSLEVAEFDCRLESGQSTHFRLPAKVQAPSCGNWEGQDVRVEVVFEPERPGEVEDTLIISSPVHGEYRCSLKGVCSPTLPQGPFTIGPGEQREIPFRNVFAVAMDFSFTADHPAFVVTSGDRQNVPAKTSKPVVIKYSPEVSPSLQVAEEGTSDARNAAGKLIVQCLGIVDLPPWVFYLQGVPPSS
ncbi:unnamed protein product, partial [Discosporangium mesarthrocarpum]